MANVANVCAVCKEAMGINKGGRPAGHQFVDTRALVLELAHYANQLSVRDFCVRGARASRCIVDMALVSMQAPQSLTGLPRHAGDPFDVADGNAGAVHIRIDVDENLEVPRNRIHVLDRLGEN